jgi:hypothetical protein
MIVTVADPQTIKDLKVGDRVLVIQFANRVTAIKKGG